jgi:hypothetical protein
MTPEDVAAVEEAYAAAEGMKTKPLPGALSMFVGHPGVYAYEYDSPKEYENDQRRAELLRRLAKYADANNLNPMGAFPPDLAGDVMAYKRGRIDETPYHYRGYTAPGSPAHNFFQVFGGIGGAAINSGKMLANAIDPDQKRYPNAKRDFDRSVNTATMYAAEDYGWLPKGTGTTADIAEDARMQRGEAPWDATSSKVRAYYDFLKAKASDEIDRSVPDGVRHLSDHGVPAPLAVIGGSAMNMILDPNPAFIGAWAKARAGAPSIRELMSETALGLGPNAVGTAPVVWDETMNYLHGVRNGGAPQIAR